MPRFADPLAATEIVLDLSRLLSRITHSTPTGVDRCEMAYARGLLTEIPDRLQFAAVHPSGFYGRLDRGATLRFLSRTEERWLNYGFHSPREKRKFIIGSLIALRPRPFKRRSHARRVYVQASPNNLTQPRLIRRILTTERARFLCLVHDLIPLEFPEYARADGVGKHRVRMETLLQHADGIITNSHSTMASLQPLLDISARSPLCAVAHLGTHIRESLDPRPLVGARPYFVCIGTIEPRKNHMLLLHVWRKMSEQFGARNIPKLILIGRRGWENEQIVDLLERCTALKGCVEEHNRMPDAQTVAVLSGAQALLLPSFAEGYGMPVTEALSLKVPVLCSDLPSLREAGDNVPEFLDPLDGPAWLQAVLDYAKPDHERLRRQQGRIASWAAPSWQNHIQTVLGLSQEISM